MKPVCILLISAMLLHGNTADFNWIDRANYLRTLVKLQDKMTNTQRADNPISNNFDCANGMAELFQRLNVTELREIEAHDNSIYEATWNVEDVGKPLLLTPMIESNQTIDSIKAAARVQDKTLDDIATSYTGYFTVNKKYNSNLFFWYIPSKSPRKDGSTPLILWLNGGPGASSLFGLFIEHGPFFVSSEELVVEKRNISWTDSYNVLYIDQPAGTGFSFTEDARGFATDQTKVANELYEALRQFFIVFEEVKDSDFYITGESYAGKYVPAISFKIHEMNQDPGNVKMQLKGLAIGDGMTDPINQINYGDFLFQIGLVSDTDRNILNNKSKIAKECIKQNLWEEAGTMIFDIILSYREMSGFSFNFNYLLSSEPDVFGHYPKFLNDAKTRKAIHVVNKRFSNYNPTVHFLLLKDIAKSVRPWLEILLDNDYKVMIYSGQLDIIIPYPQTEELLVNLQWKGADAYRAAERQIWMVDNEIAGYSREVDNLKQVMVRNAGHILPFDQPTWALEMITNFIEDKPFY